MAIVTVDLQEGFDRDVVEIWVDGERRWREDAVTTNIVVSLARSVPLEVADGVHDVRVVLPLRYLDAALRLNAAGDVPVAASIVDGRLRLEQLGERPYYL